MKIDRKWVVKIVLWSFAISVVFTFVSSQVLSGAGYLPAFIILFLFIAIGILFDVIGIASASANEKPFHSMASHGAHGAREAISLVKNADKVSSFCNDVVGDISGIVSGTTAAVIVVRLQRDFSLRGVILDLVLTGVVASLTVGGKAIGKSAAINRSTNIVYAAGRVIYFFKHPFDFLKKNKK